MIFKRTSPNPVYNLLTTCKLDSYLADIDEQAENMFSRLMKEYANRQSVAEQIKTTKSLDWIQKINNI